MRVSGLLWRLLWRQLWWLVCWRLRNSEDAWWKRKQLVSALKEVTTKDGQRGTQLRPRTATAQLLWPPRHHHSAWLHADSISAMMPSVTLPASTPAARLPLKERRQSRRSVPALGASATIPQEVVPRRRSCGHSASFRRRKSTRPAPALARRPHRRPPNRTPTCHRRRPRRRSRLRRTEWRRPDAEPPTTSAVVAGFRAPRPCCSSWSGQ